jgi:hypothetical protein
MELKVRKLHSVNDAYTSNLLFLKGKTVTNIIYMGASAQKGPWAQEQLTKKLMYKNSNKYPKPQISIRPNTT